MNMEQPGLTHRRLSIRDKLLLALLPTATVLPMIGLIEAFGRHHLLCASLASSAFLIYWDPRNEMNSVHAVIVSQVTAAGVGWSMWLLLGGGFAAAACAIPLAILLMILFRAVHPPAVSTALAFAMRLDPNGSFVLFALAVGITALLVVLQRAVLWLVPTKTRFGRGFGDDLEGEWNERCATDRGKAFDPDFRC
jgi:CBS-domain-containing membrane protein